jgi:hypothetical protein
METLFMQRAVNLLALAATAMLMSACGGGGGEEVGPCGGTGTLRLSLAYKVNGQVVDPTLIRVPTGLAVTAVPQAVGLPPACSSSVRWTFRQSSARTPVGLTFNTATGVVCGTATETGSYTIDMELRVDGYAFSLSERALFAVVAP